MSGITKKQALKLVWPYMKPHLPVIGLALFLSIPMAALAGSLVIVLKYFTDVVLVQKDYGALRLLVIALIAGGFANFVIRFFNNFLIRSAANKLTQKIRNDLYHHLLKLSIGYFNNAQGGALLSRVTNDVQLISRAVSSFIDVVKEPLTLIYLLAAASTSIGFSRSWRWYSCRSARPCSRMPAGIRSGIATASTIPWGR